MDASSRAPLNDGHSIPRIGLGVFRTRAGAEAKHAVRTALEIGYRHIDTAAIYRNEPSVGEAVRESGIDRSQIYVTTKLWNDDHDDPARALETSLKALDLGYIDLYLIHWPVQGKRVRTWKKLEKLRERGDVRSIGVSNYLVPHLQELLEVCELLPAVNQIELTPYNYRSRLDTIELCAQHGIVVEAYSPLTRGLKLGDPKLVSIAQHHGKTPAQVLIRWSLQKGFVVLPKSANEARIRENFDVFDFELVADEMGALDAMNENLTVAWDPAQQP